MKLENLRYSIKFIFTEDLLIKSYYFFLERNWNSRENL